MVKFLGYFFISLLIIVGLFILVSWILSMIHDVTILAEWRSWLPQ